MSRSLFSPNHTSPSVGRSRPASMLSNVLLPLPLGPMTAYIRPVSKAQSAFFTAGASAPR